MITMRYAILGKLTAKPKIDGRRIKVAKKAHVLCNGRTLCQAENGYKNPPRYTPIANPEPSQVCRNCRVLSGDRSAKSPRIEPPPEAGTDTHDIKDDYLTRQYEATMETDDRATETTILGAG